MNVVRSVYPLAALLALLGDGRGLAADPSPDYNKEIRPILSEYCFQCHGLDEKARKAKLRLDLPEAASRPAKSGEVAVVPGDPGRSELMKRITASDDDRMPPADTGKKLSDLQADTLRRWIASGAKYAKHWSFEPPVESRLPAVREPAWARNAVDFFVKARLEAEHLSPSQEAQKATLLRRVSLDLIGVPPTPEEMDRFLTDPSGDAYERAVDRLLASPGFGERMAVDWLDAARYADTNGYFSDKTRQAWLWRDWVIAAFNQNMPFDQFTVEQLAGDLLPNATRDQKIATGFNRNHMANNESGIIDEEYRVQYVIDRLDATTTTWLGLTMGCAQCHDHKFDPISQREFYQTFAFFNNIEEKGLITKDDPPPVMAAPSAEQERQINSLARARKQAEAEFKVVSAELKSRCSAWESKAADELPALPSGNLVAHFDFENRLGNSVAGHANAREVGTAIKYDKGLAGMAATFDGTQHAEVNEASVFDADKPWTISVWVKGDGPLGCVLSKIEPLGDRRGVEMIWQKGRLQINLVQRWGVNAIQLVTDEPMSYRNWHQVVLTYDGSRKASGLRVFEDGEPARAQIRRDSLEGSIANGEPLRIGRRDSGLGYYGQLDELNILQRCATSDEVAGWRWSEELRGILAVPPAKREAKGQALLFDYYVNHHAEEATQAAYHRMLATKKSEEAARDHVPTTLVMQEMAKPRVAHVLLRGQYDQPGETVQPDVPAALSPLPTGAPRNRLGFARWLTSPANPLTARVAVNRLWQQCFGEGLVRTVNDFGSRGELPTHPELLDWLAIRFIKSGWDVKGLLRLIVTSATYRQTSAASGALLERDPENRLLVRGPRFRLSAEAVRDQALAVSGLLIPHLGGPSVKPYQPPGLWEAVSYNGEESYVSDRSEGLWRRSLYTFWKRQSPPPALLTFDGPTREKCVVRRARTNTPLQALVLMNDETYVEASRALAASVLAAGIGNDEARMKEMFRRVLARFPESAETKALLGLVVRQKARFLGDRGAAASLISVGESKAGQNLDPVVLAAWSVAAQAILNLDETITRR
jgi:hypothetical protein